MLNGRNTPHITEVKPINFLFFRTEASLDQLSRFIPVAQELHKEAVAQNLQVTGPIHWHYIGFKGPGDPFTLEVALPVASTLPNYDGSFHFKRTSEFKCVALTHKGSWQSIGGSYEKLMGFIAAEGLKPSDVTREVYVNADFADPEADVTEIQVGVE